MMTVKEVEAACLVIDSLHSPVDQQDAFNTLMYRLVFHTSTDDCEDPKACCLALRACVKRNDF